MAFSIRTHWFIESSLNSDNSLTIWKIQNRLSSKYISIDTSGTFPYKVKCNSLSTASDIGVYPEYRQDE
jgi:hypothetical protein